MAAFTPSNSTSYKQLCICSLSWGTGGQEEGEAFGAHSTTFRGHWQQQRRDLLTRHSTKMSQDGSCIIRKDCEVPPMPVWGVTQRETVSAHSQCQHSQCQAALLGSAQEWGNKEDGFGDLTLKMVQIFPQENHSRGCWYLLFHNALLHGNLSVPLSASILAVVRESSNAF